MFKNIPYSAEGWSAIVAAISDSAADQGIPQWRLEVIFGVGDGSGRVWRSWLTKKRVARQFTRERIIKEAGKRGWLSLSDTRRKAAAEDIPDEAIYSLPNVSASSIFELPDLPDPPMPLVLPDSARLAAAALLHDAERGDGKLGGLREWATTGTNPYCDGRAWRTAVTAVRKILKEESWGDDDHVDSAKRRLYVQLVLGYRKRGYT